MTIATSSMPKLVVFDVEGVLIPRNRFFYEVGKSLGILPLLKILFFGFLYEIGVMPLKSALRKNFMVTRGVKVELFLQTLEKLPLLPNAKEAFATLKAQGYKTALISSGLPTFIVKKLADLLVVDYAVGVEVGVSDEKLTGEIWGAVIERNGKLLVLREIVAAEKVSLSECTVVADDRNNASIFLKNIQKIGFNPDFMIRIKADIVITGNLSKIMPVLNGEMKRKNLPSTKDLFREMIHGLGFFIPVIAFLAGLPIVVLMISCVVVVYFVSEWSRVRGNSVPVISAITRYAASQLELCEFTLAPIYFALGILLTLLLFPASASGAAIAIFALGDSTASLVGGTLSKKALPFNRSKTLEGTLAGFFFAFLAGAVFVSPWIALVGAAVAMTVEYLPLPVNDNLMIPLVTGLVLMLIV